MIYLTLFKNGRTATNWIYENYFISVKSIFDWDNNPKEIQKIYRMHFVVAVFGDSGSVWDAGRPQLRRRYVGTSTETPGALLSRHAVPEVPGTLRWPLLS